MDYSILIHLATKDLGDMTDKELGIVRDFGENVPNAVGSNRKDDYAREIGLEALRTRLGIDFDGGAKRHAQQLEEHADFLLRNRAPRRVYCPSSFFWDQERQNLEENSARLVDLIVRRAGCDASGAFCA